MARLRQRDDAPGSRGDDSVSGDVVHTGFGDSRCHRCEPIQAGNRCDEGFTERRDEPAGERAGRLHRHLLPQDRAQSHLESVEGAGYPQAGVRLDRRRQTRVFAKSFRNDVRPRIQIEQRPRAAEERWQDRRQAVRELDEKRVLFLRLRHTDPALRLAELHRPGIRGVRRVLDARQPARREKRQDALPVVRRTIRELQG
jgi:hypothetical protein